MLASFVYDADGQRVLGTVGGVTTVYVAGVYEYELGTGATTHYYEGNALRRSGYASDNGLYYLLQDHLHSSSATVAQTGTLAGTRNYFYPFGGNRGGAAFNHLTAKRFTGQYHEAALPGGEGLSYYNARWYDAQLGRFTTPDSIIPKFDNPQDFNRYTYVKNNPTKYEDPSGHCPLCVILIVAGIAFLAEGSTAEAPAGNYTDVPDNANGLLGVGLITGGSALAVVGPSVTAPAISKACADGDCTNEMRAGNQVVQTAQGTSVWRLPWYERGVAIENLIGRSPNLAQNFPVIDRFENGVATSIKSIDLMAKSYQNTRTLETVIRRYVMQVASFNGANWERALMRQQDILSRELLLAIPPGASQEQIASLYRLQQWAVTALPNRPVQLNWRFVR